MIYRGFNIRTVDAIDLIPEALELARMGILPAGMYRNRKFAEAGVDAGAVELAKQENTLGFLVPGIEKDQFFQGIVTDGILPRKTFSMGHAREKRYYLEARKIL